MPLIALPYRNALKMKTEKYGSYQAVRACLIMRLSICRQSFIVRKWMVRGANMV